MTTAMTSTLDPSPSSSGTAVVRVLVVEDHAVVRQAFRLLLPDARYRIDVVGEAGDGSAAVQLAQKLQPDVILMDLLLPEMDGIAATQAILRQDPHARVLVLTSDESEAAALAALRAGALGFLRKHASVDDLVYAIHSVAANQMVIPRELAASLSLTAPLTAASKPGSALTARELEVLQYLAAGYSNQAISRAMNISVDTVRSHVSHLLPKLGAANRTQAAINAVALGLIKQ
ncbi:MAG: response regulator transcription factor [Caldilineaceae bacterium]